MSAFELIADARGLARACEACASAQIVGVDTEFERSRTFFARPALLQIFDGRTAWLIDPLAAENLSCVGSVLANAGVLKVMHAALEDFPVLEAAAGTAPSPVFDTQLAAAFAGIDLAIGYERLVNELLGKSVAKSQTRSNWLRRPLSQAQLAYAVDDVCYLPLLYEQLSSRLRALGRLDWLEEETARQYQSRERDDGERDFLRLIKRVPDDPGVLGAVRSLCEWRDAEARTRDLPRRHLLDDDLLVALAQTLPERREELEALAAWHARSGRARVTDLLRATAAARDAPALARPAAATDLRPYRRLIACIRAAVKRTASDLGLPAALLAPRRLLERIVVECAVLSRDALPEPFDGWRGALLEDEIRRCLRDNG